MKELLGILLLGIIIFLSAVWLAGFISFIFDIDLFTGNSRKFCKNKEMPCIKFDTFKQWYSVNPKAWRDHGYYYNCVYKDVNNGSICLRMTWLDSFKLRQFWKTASSIKQYKVADKHLEAVLLSVQEDIKKFKENNPVYKYEKGEDIFND